jgi:hypothetical protein
MSSELPTLAFGNATEIVGDRFTPPEEMEPIRPEISPDVIGPDVADDAALP